MSERPLRDTARPRGALLLACLSLGACASVRSVALGEVAHSARPETHPIAVFHELADVSKPFVKVAHIRARDGDFGPSAMDCVLREARRHGADAVLLLETPQCTCGEGAEVIETALALRWVSG